MEHSEAISRGAAEAYLLDELSPADREAFEAHFFDCPMCARDVKEGAMFANGLREIARLEQAPAAGMQAVPPRRRPDLRAIYGLAASVLLAGVLLYQNAVTIPGLKASASAQALASYSLQADEARGPGSTLVAEGRRPFLLLVDLPPSGERTDYVCTIRSSAGKTVATFPISATQARTTIPILIPAAKLAAGSYALDVFAAPVQPGAAIAHYPFEVR